SYYFEPSAYKAFTDYDPDRANRMLDEMGLTARDYEGFRTFRDGSRMTFYLNICGYISAAPAEFVAEDWKRIGVRAIVRNRSRQLWDTEVAAREHDFAVWGSDSEYIPILGVRFFVPTGYGVFQAAGYAKWYDRGGMDGQPEAAGPGCVEPPGADLYCPKPKTSPPTTTPTENRPAQDIPQPDEKKYPILASMWLWNKVCGEGNRQEQRDLFRRILRIAAENVWTINVCTPAPEPVVVKDGMKNVPRSAVSCWKFTSPANTGIETYYFEHPSDTPGAIRQIRQAIEEVTPPPDAPAAVAAAEARSGRLGSLIRYAFVGIALLLAVLACVRHPYIARRLLIMIPTLLIISVIVFTIIQLPPGDYLTTRIMQLREAGEQADMQQIENIRRQFHLEDPIVVRYGRWMGLAWFTSFKDEDAGLLQGNLGRSMENSRPVNQIVGDRVVLTVLISLGTILMTWAIAVPTGIYSAVRQYSPGDYILTFIGFLGMCVPSFLLALVLMYLAKRHLGVEISGLFSSRYGAQPEWDWPKVADLLKHIWLPVVVLGVGGTAGMIRVMRGNLLDELNKPYVTTARAKGVRPGRLLLKYPVRLALNPFISGIGGLFPQLVSGGAIVAMVLSLPTVGPMMLQALMTEDFCLAGSMLMVLSLLGVFGTLVSDLLLLWLDPRIRFQGGSR
ncbi:MAG TPA: ABC transporter permease subunit, partial [Phycisphaerae bacterium]|nr:ABC transporter permease subunit [Phycisphaerae bacterium]